jgi:CubicO group peptidase (beta-lactamase class C family)
VRTRQVFAAAAFAFIVALPATAQQLAQPAAPATTATPALTAEDANAWLDGYMPYALKTGDIAGAVVVIVKDGKILTERGYGYSDVAKRTPVDPALTLFRPGSVSKLLTWTAVMQQVEKGRIDLDADINRYLDFRIPPRDGKPVTMRNLMTHTAGFEEHAKYILSSDGKMIPPYDAILKKSVPNRIFPPGTTPAYSNYGASLAGYIVQRVSGESFYDYMDHHILEPLDMKHSSFRQPLPPSLAPLMSKGYLVASGKPMPFEFVGPAPAGALSATGEDMGHFMIAHLEDGEYQGRRILEAATAEMMHNSPLTIIPPLDRMELGFFETNVDGHEVIGHLGDTQAFHTSLHLFLKEGVGFYASFNSPGKAAAVSGLRGAVFEDFADRYFPGSENDGKVDAKTSAQHARLMAGRWEPSRRSESSFLNIASLLGQLKVSVGADGGLVVPIPGLNGVPRRWVEIAPFVWRDRDSHMRLAGKVVDGKVTMLSFDEVSPFTVYQRPPWNKNAGWLVPLLVASLAALCATALLWPVRALVRRSYRAPATLDARSLRAYRLSRIAAIAIIAALVGWALALTKMLGDLGNLTDRLDPLIWFLEIFGAVAFIGGAALMLWNLRVVWRGERSWQAKVWTIVLALSSLVVLWVAVGFKLIAFGVHY